MGTGNGFDEQVGRDIRMPRYLTVDCGMAPLTCVLVEAGPGLIINDRSTYGEGFRVLEIFSRDFSREGTGTKVSELSPLSRAYLVVTFLRDEVMPKLQEEDVVLIERQIPPTSRACDSSIPFESFVSSSSFFCTVGMRVFDISPCLKNKVDIGANPMPAKEYKGKHARNKAIACSRLDYLGVELPGCGKGARHHVADAILQLVGFLSIKGTNVTESTRLS